jgi:hypothetical protein
VILKYDKLAAQMREFDADEQIIRNSNLQLERQAELIALITQRRKEDGKAASETGDEMSKFAEQGARNMQDAFANFLFDPFKNGLKGMLIDFINVIRRMVAEAIAAKIITFVFSLFSSAAGAGSGAGGGAGGGAAPAAGHAAGGRTDATKGGRQHGPGTPTSDSIPVWVSDTEGVIKGESMQKLDRKYGPSFFDYLNEKGELPDYAAAFVLPALKIPTVKFSAGGRVNASAANGRGGATNVDARSRIEMTNINVVDPALVHDAMASAGGTRVLLNVMTNNPRAFKQALEI